MSSVKKPVRLSLLAKARALREYGFRTCYGTKKKGCSSPQAKGAVTKAWNRIRLYTENSKQTFKFVPLPKTKAGRIAKGATAKRQRVPGGAFFHVPKGVRKSDYRVKIGPQGEIIARAKGKRGGQRTEHTWSIDPELVADDPMQVLEDMLAKAGKKPDLVQFVVNGNDGAYEYSWEAFLTYGPETLSAIMDPTEEQRRKHGDALEPEYLAEIFQIKFIYQTKSTKPTRHGRKKKKVRSR